MAVVVVVVGRGGGGRVWRWWWSVVVGAEVEVGDMCAMLVARGGAVVGGGNRSRC